MLKAYKYRLYPNASQRTLIEKHFGCARWIYNWALEKRVKAYEKDKSTISRFDLQKEIPALKKGEDTAWLAEVNSQSLQVELKHLDTAYQRFFREKKGFPKFKNRHGRQSFQCPQRGSIDGNAISIPKLQNIKAVIDRTFEGQIKTVTISRTTTNKYFASVLVDNGEAMPEKAPITEATTIGIDLGLTHFATLSTGEKIANPRHLKSSLKRLRRAQRKLSRRKKDSKNRNKQRIKVALLHEKVTNQRRDFQHKLSTRLIRENQAVALETLNVTGMVKNRRLSRSISDAGWSQFADMLTYKAEWYGKSVLRIGRYEPSSKLCSCGILNHSLKLSDRIWTCTSCNTTHDRDLLAANNIKRMALHPGNFLAQGMREFTPVETSVTKSLKQECPN